MARHRKGDGIRRRDVLNVGLLGGLGLSLADYLNLVQAGQVNKPKAQAAIFFNLAGGPPHLDLFDMKPEAPDEYRGKLRPIKTNVPGIEISEQLPLLARCADKFTILRGVSHNVADHGLGAKYVSTGNRPLPSLDYPSLGSIAAKELSCSEEMPAYVTMQGGSAVSSGYLGVRFGPFQAAAPRMGQRADSAGLERRATNEVLARRMNLRNMVDTTFAAIEKQSDVLIGLDEFSKKAYSMLSSDRARDALDLTKEPEHIVQRFGDKEAGQSALAACRLIEAGSRFVSLGIVGWDLHIELYQRLNVLAPALDQALSALLTTLDERGLLDTTLVIVTGEFGRTPKINTRSVPGRDHWPRAMFVLMAGGGVKNGQVIGASDAKGEGPDDTTMTPDDVAATALHALGIDPHKEYHTNSGRPITIVRDGNVIPGLFA